MSFNEIPQNPIPKRILYFSRDYSTHDHRFLSALASAARGSGAVTEHPLEKIYYLRLERGGHVLEERALPPEIEIVHWSGGKKPARLSDGPRLLLSLKKALRAIKPDVILAGPIQRSAFLVALSGFRPLISMSWGYDLLQDARRNAAWSWATRYTLQRSAALVGDCQTIRDLAISYGMPAERIVTFPWGVDLDHFKPAVSGDQGGYKTSGEYRTSEPPNAASRDFQPLTGTDALAFTLLSVRNWEPIYGVDVIARAFVKAAAKQPELRLVMLGNGSQTGMLRQILGQVNGVEMQHSAGPHSSHRVLFPGLVGFNDLPRYYRSADLYISASHSDGSSISLLEAMACGRPVLVSDIPGNREWVQPGVNGWLFPDGDADALAEAILHALDQRSRLPEMGIQARQIAEQRADWQKNFPNLFRTIEIAFKHTH